MNTYHSFLQLKWNIMGKTKSCVLNVICTHQPRDKSTDNFPRSIIKFLLKNSLKARTGESRAISLQVLYATFTQNKGNKLRSHISAIHLLGINWHKGYSDREYVLNHLYRSTKVQLNILENIPKFFEKKFIETGVQPTFTIKVRFFM